MYACVYVLVLHADVGWKYENDQCTGLNTLVYHFTSGIFRAWRLSELGWFISLQEPLNEHVQNRNKHNKCELQANMEGMFESYVNKPLCFHMPTKLKHFTQLAKNTQFFSLSLSLFFCCCFTPLPSLSSPWNLRRREGHPGTYQVETPPKAWGRSL